MRIDKESKLSYADWLRIAEDAQMDGEYFKAYRALRVAERLDEYFKAAR